MIIKTIKTSLITVAVTSILLAPSATVLANEFPSAPIQVAVAYGPGGATDFQARIATMMAGNEKYLNMPMVIFNMLRCATKNIATMELTFTHKVRSVLMNG